MNPQHRTYSTLRASLLRRGAAGVALVVTLLGGGAASATDWSLAVGPVGGVLALDAALADYRWDTTPTPVWGLDARISAARVGLGVRVWRSGTTQSIGIPGESSAPDVKLTGTEALGAFRVASLAGVQLLASANVGALHLGWSPDRVTLPPLGAGSSIQVSFDPVTEWIGGVGITAQRRLFGGLDLSLGIERSWFQLDTAHRAGTEIVTGRDTFGNWMVRAQLSHRVLQL